MPVLLCHCLSTITSTIRNSCLHACMPVLCIIKHRCPFFCLSHHFYRSNHFSTANVTRVFGTLSAHFSVTSQSRVLLYAINIMGLGSWVWYILICTVHVVAGCHVLHSNAFECFRNAIFHTYHLQSRWMFAFCFRGQSESQKIDSLLSVHFCMHRSYNHTIAPHRVKCSFVPNTRLHINCTPVLPGVQLHTRATMSS